MIDELIADLTELTRSQVLEGVAANHPADQATDVYQVDVELATIRDLAVELREIDEALDRIETGDYGLCADCQLPIDAGRLSILPTARRCLVCQTLHESLSSFASS
jgi:RNA polymerase-binding transcription factor DksA